MRLLHFQYISTLSYAMLIVRTSLHYTRIGRSCSQHDRRICQRGNEMIGRQVILINKPLTLRELEQIMQDNWDKEQYGSFKIGRPTPASIEEYILLPATRRYLTIDRNRRVSPRKGTAAEYFADEKRPECRKREKRPG